MDDHHIWASMGFASGGAKLLKHAVVKAGFPFAGSGKCQSLQTNGCV